MKRVVLLVMAGVLGISAPAFASVQNMKLSGDIETSYIHRHKLDLGTTSANQFRQDIFITQTRLRLDADLTDQVSTTISLINERAWNEDREDDGSASATGGSNDVDIHLAYVTLREMLYQPLTVVIGRQSFAYGNSFVIDSGGPDAFLGGSGGLKGVAEDLSKRRAMDAVRLILDYNPVTIDLVGAKPDANTVGGLVPHDDDVDLYGVNVNYKRGDQWDTVLETYFWSRIDNSVKTNSLAGILISNNGLEPDTLYMPGLRFSVTPVKDLLILQGEIAVQRGNKATTFLGADNVNREAFGGQAIAIFFLPWEPFKTMHSYLVSVYTYLSGDSGAAEAGTHNDDHYTQWDGMYENQGRGSLFNSFAAYAPTSSHSMYLRWTNYFSKDIHLDLSWLGVWLDKPLDDSSGGCGPALTCIPIRQPDGRLITTKMTNNSHYLDEVGFKLVYDYTEDVELNGGMMWLIPGNAFHGDNDQVATQGIVSTLVKF